MIDMHTHVLPGIDDGSRDPQESLQLLRLQQDMGVETVCATPHFYASRISVDDFLSRRRASAGRLAAFCVQAIRNSRSEGEELRLPKILSGAEVYFFDGIGRAEKLPLLTLAGTDLLLLEMPFRQWTNETLRDVEEILQRQKLHIMIAHVERYREFQKDKGPWHRLLELPVTLQINGGTLLRRGQSHRFAMKLLTSRPEDIILSSDCHNLTTRRPNLAAAMDTVDRKLGTGIRQQLVSNAARLLRETGLR